MSQAFFTPAFLIIALACLPLMAGAQGPAPAANAPAGASSAPATALAAAPDEGPSVLTRAAVQRGVLQCAARIEQVSRFLGFGPQAGALLIAPASPVDQRLLSMAMELPAGANGNTLVDMTFAPSQANGCGATYQSISHWTQSCESLATSQFASLRRMRALQKEVTVLDGGPATKVFLMKAGESGCISIKKEVVL